MLGAGCLPYNKKGQAGDGSRMLSAKLVSATKRVRGQPGLLSEAVEKKT